MGAAQGGREVWEVTSRKSNQWWDMGPEVRERSGPRHLHFTDEEEVPSTRGVHRASQALAVPGISTFKAEPRTMRPPFSPHSLVLEAFLLFPQDPATAYSG